MSVTFLQIAENIQTAKRISTEKKTQIMFGRADSHQ